MRALGYAEVALVVEDVERSASFCVEVVGYEPAGFDMGDGARILKVGPDNYLGLWETGMWGGDSLPFGGAYGSEFRSRVGQAHLVFAIHQDDVHPLAERLKKGGYPA